MHSLLVSYIYSFDFKNPQSTASNKVCWHWIGCKSVSYQRTRAVLNDFFRGNTIIIGSTASCIISLTWAGVKYSWSSIQVLTPLILGLLGLVVAFLYEAFVAKHPSVSIFSIGQTFMFSHTSSTRSLSASFRIEQVSVGE